MPRTRFLGAMPDDILDYGLPTHKLTEVDVRRIDDVLGNDPFVRHYKRWQEPLEKLKESGC